MGRSRTSPLNRDVSIELIFATWPKAHVTLCSLSISSKFPYGSSGHNLKENKYFHLLKIWKNHPLESPVIHSRFLQLVNRENAFDINQCFLGIIGIGKHLKDTFESQFFELIVSHCHDYAIGSTGFFS